ncbi:MAG: hypothetical protein IT508_10745 [Burkholderiaceae bacterium]|nr:hypothetical protein [Burkholderiaceae bacterium]
MTTLVKILRQRRKAIAAALVPFVAWAAGRIVEHAGDLTLPATWPELVIIVITGVTVHEIPNDPQEG